ncbi:MAG: superoxide dismutase, partial [Methylococcales bacterium]
NSLAAVSPPTFTLPALPYDQAALDPVISANTISFHYGKHHAGYVNNLNTLITGTKYEKMSLERIIKATYGKKLLPGMIYNNAAQAWNHTFYWRSLKPGAGDLEAPTGKLLALINAQYGHFSDTSKDVAGNWTNPGLKQKLFDAAKNHFGSGWAWLVVNGTKLDIITTVNADTPLTQGMTPLLVIDVWEHAYYLDYKNGRTTYLNGVLDKLINWQFATDNLPTRLKIA